MARHSESPPFECVALTLQGGGALGAYQGGVYQALSEAALYPTWVAGISIGSINAAIIAGNPPETRVDKLRGFWESITSTPFFDALRLVERTATRAEAGRKMFNHISAMAAFTIGVTGFFRPRIPALFFGSAASASELSYYDTQVLIGTLERFVDFDRINSGETRFSAGAVNVRTGNFVYFDSMTRKIKPEHILASAALPPGFPAVEIDGEFYWDGGLVSNTPLQWVLEFGPRQDTLAFEVDLWSSRGRIPRSFAEVATREKEIRFSSRTRDNTDRFADIQRIRHAIAELMGELPTETLERPHIRSLKAFADCKVYNIVHLIYGPREYEGVSKDYEFSQLSMKDHWKAGYHDTVRTLRHPEALNRPKNSEGLAIFDFSDTESA